MYAVRVCHPSKIARKEIRNSFLRFDSQKARNRKLADRINGYASPRNAGGQNAAGLIYREENENTRDRANVRLAIIMIRRRNFFKSYNLRSKY